MSMSESTFSLHIGDCIDILRTLDDNSIDSIVTDPPYGLSFMGKKWDYDVPSVEVWAECLRVLKPGGYLLAFAGTRTQHRMAVRIEDAGFEIRDMIAWVYGSGFPKSMDVSKAIDGKLTTGRSDSIALREVNETRPGEATIRSQSLNGHAGFVGSGDVGPSVKRDTPTTDAASQWQGWGTALKPAIEPITVARKPLAGTVAENVLRHGTGALNIDGCRVAGESTRRTNTAEMGHHGGNLASEYQTGSDAGRWPANLIHDGSEEVLAAFPQAPGQQAAISGKAPSEKTSNVYGRMRRDGEASADSDNDGAVGFKMKPGMRRLDAGSAARFFYCAKASKRDRNEGCEHIQAKPYSHDGRETPIENAYQRNASNASNSHPTVKPTDLMAYLCRLVTPPGGTVLDPFMGSGSTGKAAMREGFRFIGIEREAEYVSIAEARIKSVLTNLQTDMFSGSAA